MYILERLFIALVISLFYTFFSFFVMYAVSKIKKDESVLDKFGDIWGYLYIVNMIMVFLILIFFNINV